MQIGKKVIEVREHENVDVFCLGDVHEGHGNCNVEAIHSAVELIEQNRKDNAHTYTILMGDLPECIIMSDPRFNPLEIADRYKVKDLSDLPKRQADTVVGYLDPIKDTITAILEGNHCKQYVKRHNFDVYSYMWVQLGTPFKLGYNGRLRFTSEMGNSRFKIDFALNHGTGGGGFREGYPINKVHDIFRWTVADFYVMGHVHSLNVDPQLFEAVNEKGDGIDLRQRWYGISGCFLNGPVKGKEHYFEGRPGPLPDIGMLKCSFNFGRKRSEGGRRYLRKTKMEPIYLDREI